MESFSDFSADANRNLSLRDQGKQDRMRRIRDAATALLFRYPIDEITTKDIAERARVGEATLFRYVKNKNHLLDLVYGDQLDAVLDEIEAEDRRSAARIAPGGATANDYISRVLGSYERRCDFYLLAPVNASHYLREGFKTVDSGNERHLRQGDRSIGLTKEIILSAQREGKLSADVDAQIVAQNCHGTYIHEIDRTPVRGFAPSTIWQRLRIRLEVQLRPLSIDE